MRLTDLLALSHVPRWSIVDHAKPQSVGDHTFRVVIIAWELADRIKTPLNCSTLRYILAHDAPESRTADIPNPAKSTMSLKDDVTYCPWMFGLFPNGIDSEQEKIFKLADKVEGYTFIAKYGIGAHAVLVAGSCKEELMQYAEECGWGAAVRGVCDDILSDSGRFRGLSPRD